MVSQERHSMELEIGLAGGFAAVLCSAPSRCPAGRIPDRGSCRRRDWRQISLTCMLAIADSVAAHAGLTGPLLTVDQHGEEIVLCRGCKERQKKKKKIGRRVVSPNRVEE